MSSAPMEVDTWKGDWGLPSVDIHCLEIMAYAKFSGAPVKVACSNNPFFSPSGSLPVFRHGKVVLTSFENVVDYLHSKQFCADHNLTAAQKAETLAFSHLIRSKLFPGILYTWWVDQKNFTDITRPWYAKAVPFPLNYYYPGHYERDSKRLIESMFVDEEDQSVIEAHLLTEAEICLDSLSIRLGDREYFFGKSPSSLDAIVYAHLAPILRAPFVNNAVSNHVKAFPKLTNFVARISQRYFPHCVQEYEIKHTEEKSKKLEVQSKHWRQLLSFIVAVSAMSAYAVYNNILKNTRMSRRFATKVERMKARWRTD